MIETPTEDRKRSKTLGIVIVLFACLGGLCLTGVIGYVGYSYLGLSTVLGTGPTPQSAVLIPPDDVSSADATVAPGDTNILSGDLLDLIEDGSITVDGIHIPKTMLIAQPPQPEFKVNNPGSKDLVIGIACGLTLKPPVDTEARLMVYQKAETRVPAGGSVNIDLMVVSIEAAKSTPSGIGVYTVDTMVEGELLDFANCLCGQDIKAQAGADENWYSEVVFATWSVSDDYPISLMMENTDLFAAFTGGTPTCLETVYPRSMSILETCGITPYDPRTGTKPPPATPTP